MVTAFTISVQPEDTPPERKFDEAHALEQLEQLHAQILRARAARRRVEAEFDAFIQGFRSERRMEADHAPAVDITPERDTRPGIGLRDASLAPEEHASIPDVTGAVVPVVAQPVPPRRRRTRAAVIALSALAIGVTAFAVRGRRVTPPPQTTQPAANATKPRESIATPPPPSAQTAPAQPGVNLVLLTRRRVWVRVTIDGRRAFERELAADQRIPLHGDSTIVIRAGDAGAVALTRDGRDAGVLGRDGMVATRAFTVGR